MHSNPGRWNIINGMEIIAIYFATQCRLPRWDTPVNSVVIAENISLPLFAHPGSFDPFIWLMHSNRRRWNIINGMEMIAIQFATQYRLPRWSTPVNSVVIAENISRRAILPIQSLRAGLHNMAAVVRYQFGANARSSLYRIQYMKLIPFTCLHYHQIRCTTVN